MSSIKKELYNHSFEDVLNQSVIPENILRLESKKLCRSALEIYRAAQSAHRGGDEELAFILYMRYIHIIESLQKKTDYRKKHVELTEMFGGNKSLLNALDTAEALRKSLMQRFNELDSSRKSSSSKNVEALPATGKQNGSSSKSKSPLPIVNEPQKVSSRGSVSPKDLFGIIQDGRNNVLIIERMELEDKQEELQQMKLKFDQLQEQMAKHEQYEFVSSQGRI